MCSAGRVKVLTEYYQQRPDGSLLEMKPLLDPEKPLPRPQAEVPPAQGLGQHPPASGCCATCSHPMLCCLRVQQGRPCCSIQQQCLLGMPILTPGAFGPWCEKLHTSPACRMCDVSLSCWPGTALLQHHLPEHCGHREMALTVLASLFGDAQKRCDWCLGNLQRLQQWSLQRR